MGFNGTIEEITPNNSIFPGESFNLLGNGFTPKQGEYQVVLLNDDGKEYEINIIYSDEKTLKVETDSTLPPNTYSIKVLYNNEEVIHGVKLTIKRRKPILTTISPANGIKGSEINVDGKYFHPSENSVLFYQGEKLVKTISASSSSETKITFQVPEDIAIGNYLLNIESYGAQSVFGLNFSVWEISIGNFLPRTGYWGTKLAVSITGFPEDNEKVSLFLKRDDLTYEIKDFTLSERSVEFLVPYNIPTGTFVLQATIDDKDYFSEGKYVESEMKINTLFPLQTQRGNIIEISGEGFFGGEEVLKAVLRNSEYEEVALSVLENSGEKIKIVVPDDPSIKLGTYEVTVKNGNKQKTSSETIEITETKITGISPVGTFVGREVTIYGYGFTWEKEKTSIILSDRFGGESTHVISEKTDKSILFKVPENTKYGKYSIKVLQGEKDYIAPDSLLVLGGFDVGISTKKSFHGERVKLFSENFTKTVSTYSVFLKNLSTQQEYATTITNYSLRESIEIEISNAIPTGEYSIIILENSESTLFNTTDNLSIVGLLVTGIEPSEAFVGDVVKISSDGLGSDLTSIQIMLKDPNSPSTVYYPTITSVSASSISFVVLQEYLKSSYEVEVDNGVKKSKSTDLLEIKEFTISDISPSFGDGGTEITITGDKFAENLSENNVTLTNNSNVQDIYTLTPVSVTETSLKAIVPTNIIGGRYKITVERKTEKATLAERFIVEEIEINSVSSTTPYPSENITISGKKFVLNGNSGNTTVSFTSEGEAPISVPISTANESTITLQIPQDFSSGEYKLSVSNSRESVTHIETIVIPEKAKLNIFPDTVEGVLEVSVLTSADIFSPSNPPSKVRLYSSSTYIEKDIQTTLVTANKITFLFPSGVSPAEYTLKVLLGSEEYEVSPTITVEEFALSGLSETRAYPTKEIGIMGTAFFNDASSHVVKIFDGDTEVAEVSAENLINQTLYFSFPTLSYKGNTNLTLRVVKNNGASASLENPLISYEPLTVIALDKKFYHPGDTIIIQGGGMNTEEDVVDMYSYINGVSSFVTHLEIVSTEDSEIHCKIPPTAGFFPFYIKIFEPGQEVQFPTTLSLAEVMATIPDVSTCSREAGETPVYYKNTAETKYLTNEQLFPASSGLEEYFTGSEYAFLEIENLNASAGTIPAKWSVKPVSSNPFEAAEITSALFTKGEDHEVTLNYFGKEVSCEIFNIIPVDVTGVDNRRKQDGIPNNIFKGNDTVTIYGQGFDSITITNNIVNFSPVGSGVTFSPTVVDPSPVIASRDSLMVIVPTLLADWKEYKISVTVNDDTKESTFSITPFVDIVMETIVDTDFGTGKSSTLIVPATNLSPGELDTIAIIDNLGNEIFKRVDADGTADDGQITFDITSGLISRGKYTMKITRADGISRENVDDTIRFFDPITITAVSSPQKDTLQIVGSEYNQLGEKDEILFDFLDPTISFTPIHTLGNPKVSNILVGDIASLPSGRTFNIIVKNPAYSVTFQSYTDNSAKTLSFLNPTVKADSVDKAQVWVDINHCALSSTSTFEVASGTPKDSSASLSIDFEYTSGESTAFLDLSEYEDGELLIKLTCDNGVVGNAFIEKME